MADLASGVKITDPKTIEVGTVVYHLEEESRWVVRQRGEEDNGWMVVQLDDDTGQPFGSLAHIGDKALKERWGIWEEASGTQSAPEPPERPGEPQEGAEYRWEVGTAVWAPAGETKELDRFLAAGWEPFAVTPAGGPRVHYHFRRIVMIEETTRCPRDTDGDGHCPDRYCPVCGGPPR